MESPETIREPPSPSEPSSPPPPSSSKPLVLQVGAERFMTTAATLSRSAMLAAKISDHWNSEKQADGSYFLDADPEIFKYVLRFLRHGVYPLAYDGAKGHDVGLYAAILQLADFLLVEKLASWLKEQRYLKVVQIETSTRVLEMEEKMEKFSVVGSESRVQWHPSWRVVKKYVCPRGITKHYDNPSDCGQACRKSQGDKEDVYEDCYALSVMIVKKKTVFHAQLCVED
ncbi:MAG: hypothetical protein Q9202_006234 [Teloschistes flavicans]